MTTKPQHLSALILAYMVEHQCDSITAMKAICGADTVNAMITDLYNALRQAR